MTDPDLTARGADSTAPLVSVICRTTGRAELRQALQSIVAQHYRPIEVVLVDAAGDGLEAYLPWCDDLAVTPVSDGTPLSRSRAANRGLDAASGEFLIFLDEDDWIAPQHVANLMRHLSSQGTCRAVYSSTRKASQQGELLEDLFDLEFDPVLLKRDNYIPIHAMVFDAGLVASGCRFDEDFDIYEDWDFWLQLSRHTNFHHIKDITAFYREGGASQTDDSATASRYDPDHTLGKARARLYSKWLNLWSGEEFNQLIGLMDATDVLREKDRQLAGMHDEVVAVNRQIKAINEHRDQLLIELSETEERLSDTEDHLYHTRLHERDLEVTLTEIYNSRSWRVSAPVRVVFRLIGTLKQWCGRQIIKYPLGRKLLQMRPGDTSFGKSRQRPDPERVKANFDEQAGLAFDSFLAGDQYLHFPRPEKPTVSIILVFFNRAPLSYLCLRSILEHGGDEYEVVIVDNASEDQSEELLARLQNVAIIRNSANEGFVKAVNQAADKARGTNLLLLNNDAELEADAISHALAALASANDIGAVGGKINLLDGSLQEAGSIIWNNGSCLGYGRGDDPQAGEYMFRRPVDYCSGAFLLIPRSLFLELGGFDTAFAPAYYEESDFCIRVWKTGRQVIYEPRARIRHYEFASTGGFENASLLQSRHRDILCGRHKDFLANKYAPTDGNVLAARTANSLPSILFIDDCVPHPELGAGYPRCAEFLREIDRLPLNLTFYPLQFWIDDWERVYETVSIETEVMLFQGRDGLRRFLQSRRGHYDYILVSRVHNMEFLRNIVDAEPELIEGVKLVYDAEALTAPREIMRLQLLGEKINEARQQKMIENEIALARNTHRVITVSEAESDIYKAKGLDNTIVLGHKIRINETPATFEERSEFLFVGALRDDNSPNVDSLFWFVNEVLPILDDLLPTPASLVVVGDNTAPTLRELHDERVKFLGLMKDLEATYNRCRVFIAPTRFAAGIPHKIHEAAGHGIPTVATSILARQLNWQAELLVADKAEDFARQCARLYTDKALWQQLRDLGLRATERDCTPERFTEQIAKIFI